MARASRWLDALVWAVVAAAANAMTAAAVIALMAFFTCVLLPLGCVNP
jgi:hypothetical protein